jgi:ribA/ribD-fused uncharacterized protein
VCFCVPLPCHAEIIVKRIKNTKYCVNWFSNMRKMDGPIVHQGVEYWTVENFYQAMKVDRDDVLARTKIAAASPFEAKKMGRELKLRADWDEIKIQVMQAALARKFAIGTSWRNKLQMFDKPIVEYNNWGDKFWGVDICSGEGQNILGKLITQIKIQHKN